MKPTWTNDLLRLVNQLSTFLTGFGIFFDYLGNYAAFFVAQVQCLIIGYASTHIPSNSDTFFFQGFYFPLEAFKVFNQLVGL